MGPEPVRSGAGTGCADVHATDLAGPGRGRHMTGTGAAIGAVTSFCPDRRQCHGGIVLLIGAILAAGQVLCRAADTDSAGVQSKHDVDRFAGLVWKHVAVPTNHLLGLVAHPLVDKTLIDAGGSTVGSETVP